MVSLLETPPEKYGEVTIATTCELMVVARQLKQNAFRRRAKSPL